VKVGYAELATAVILGNVKNVVEDYFIKRISL
jgi:hypothetical protein